ncbi:MAG TPA: carboxypeptidase-like regulatory domain-containing protein [Thermoanaerobaculia bacterium]|nr:carboxypeptidase-like regulatory domain-containing protein [Thermoanaerobaculia bacterium]
MRRAVRIAALVLICAIAGLPLSGQTAGHIRGTVVDDDGKPLEGVQVEATQSSAKRSTKTGKDGQFRFTMIPPGAYVVHFSLPKYSEVEKRANVRLDGTATVDAKLFRLSNEAGGQ